MNTFNFVLIIFWFFVALIAAQIFIQSKQCKKCPCGHDEILHERVQYAHFEKVLLCRVKNCYCVKGNQNV